MKTNGNSKKIPLLNAFAETLRETLEGIEQSQEEVANQVGITKQILSSMKLGRRRCTPEIDLRLSRYFGTTEGYWMRLQLDHDIRKARREKGSQIEKEVGIHA